jgi:hypothetical protein
MKTVWIAILTITIGKAYSQSEGLSNVPSKTTTRAPIAEGLDVWGVFHGRVPCQEMAGELQIPVESNCEVFKWAFTFFKDPATGKLTTYKWEGSLFRDKAVEGQCQLLKGIPGNPEAVVLQLVAGKAGYPLFFLKGDDNVLFILDKDKNLMKGNDYLSYTFNRVSN